MEQKLCTSCQQIIDSFSEFVDAMDIPHGSVAQVISNAERGCLICALIRNTLGKEKAQVFGSYQYEIQTTLTMSSIGTAFIELNINSKAPSTQLPEIGLMSEDMEMQFQKIAAEPSEQVRGVWPSFVNGIFAPFLIHSQIINVLLQYVSACSSKSFPLFDLMAISLLLRAHPKTIYHIS